MSIFRSIAAAILNADSNAGNGTDTTTIHNLPTGSASDVFTNILDITYFVIGVVAVIVIIFAGIMYTTSAGNPANIKKAKDAIVYAIVGLVIALLAFVITQFVAGRINA